MQGQNQRILGAFIVGVALIAGTYTWVNFGAPKFQQASVSNATAPVRSPIAVSDKDENGIEDWRDVFTTTESVILSSSSAATYEPPTTVTGKLGIQFFEDIIRAKNYGPFGRSEQEVVTDTVNTLSRNTEQKIYGLSDVTIMNIWNDGDIKNYANTMANIITTNNKPGMDDEIVILNDIMNNERTERIAELNIIADVYKNMRDDSLLIPVPEPLLKEHLDLINTYEAVYQDIAAMALSTDDPAVSLLRVKRYQDDSLGLGLALENMYGAIEPYASLFSSSDPAMLFSNFSSSGVGQQ